MHPTLKKALQIIKYFLLCLVVLLVFLIAFIHLPIGHSILTSQVNSILKNNGLPISVGKITLSIVGDIELSKIEMLESSGDTIFYGGNIKVSFKVLPLFSKQLILNDIRVDDVVCNLFADSSGQLNLMAYFPSSPATTEIKPESTNTWDLILDEAHLYNINFLYSNPVKGIFIQQSLYKADLSFDSFSFFKKQIDVGTLKLNRVNGMASISTQIEDTIPNDTIPSPWKFSAKNIELTDIAYKYTNPSSKLYLAASLKHSNLILKKLDLTSSELTISQLKVEDPVITFSPSETPSANTAQIEPGTIYPKEFEWTIVCELFNIKNGNFSIENFSSAESNIITQWLPVQKLNTTIKNIYLEQKGMGLELNELSASLNNKLFLQTGKLEIKADSTMQGKMVLDLLATTGKETNAPFSANDTIVVSVALAGSMNVLNIEKFSADAYSGIQLDVSGSIKNLTQIPDSRCELKFHTNSISQYQAEELISGFKTSMILPNSNRFNFQAQLKTLSTIPIST
ncbi:MAG: AsmA family protein [Bacteroidetes bacterium]|nr:AsmA family protein [Bacteroidota bacterium]